MVAVVGVEAQTRPAPAALTSQQNKHPPRSYRPNELEPNGSLNHLRLDAAFTLQYIILSRTI